MAIFLLSYGCLAQLVERCSHEAEVPGSTPGVAILFLESVKNLGFLLFLNKKRS